LPVSKRSRWLISLEHKGQPPSKKIVNSVTIKTP
jgi:hypothetical protein